MDLSEGDSGGDGAGGEALAADASGPDPAELSAGQLIAGRYRIEGRLGTGGIGVVYSAVQLPLERPVAIKVLHDDYLLLDELRARFEREARALSRLTDPHVVAISDYGVDAERPYLVMERLEGHTLEEVLRRDPIDPDRAMAIGRQILSGLAAAHARGIAHRDLKPANVFLSRMPDGSEHVKLLDFGLARIFAAEAEEPGAALTQRGVVFGTPAYMSPEQASGAPADLRSDVYSAGLLLFELLTGRRPFLGETRAELLRAQIAEAPPRLAAIRPELRVRPDLIDLLNVAMAKEPKERFADAEDMLAALDVIEAPVAWVVPDHEVSEAPTQVGGTVEGRPRRRAWLTLAAALGAVALLAGGYWLYERSATESGPIPDQPAAEDGVIADQPASRRADEPRDPWAQPPPEPLRPFLAMVERGQVFEDHAEVAPLYQLVQAMPGDPRPLLLLGHLFVSKGWYTEGIVRYERAAAVDASARADPRMREALLSLAARESVGDRAAAALEAIYGREILPDLEAAIDAAADRPLDQLRLVQLRDRLRGDAAR